MPTHNSLPARWTTARRARTLAAAGVAGVLLSACGSSAGPSTATTTAKAAPLPTHLLNTKRVALAIEDSILSERRLHSTVKCPAAVPQEQGRSFQCIATTVSHKKAVKTVFTVFQKNDKGNVYYASPK